ncbi:DnaJ domain-containing protein [Desulfococcus sp.]|uniref:DnaJ domain-containing protein n=1 Tax=Desulfococcus sp. TaxID=2025834 RepID=UPI0035930CD8
MKLIGIIIALIYTLFPADVLPDMIPVLGWLDDAALWVLFFWYFFMRLRETEGPPSEDPDSRQEGPGQSRGGTGGEGDPEGFRKQAGGGASKDPYTVLGIERGAPPEAVKKAYRELAAKYHPDKFAHLGEDFQKTAEKRFKEIHEAYRTLMPRN